MENRRVYSTRYHCQLFSTLRYMRAGCVSVKVALRSLRFGDHLQQGPIMRLDSPSSPAFPCSLPESRSGLCVDGWDARTYPKQGLTFVMDDDEFTLTSIDNPSLIAHRQLPGGKWYLLSDHRLTSANLKQPYPYAK